MISEQNNIPEIVPDGFKKTVNVKELLNGIESEEKRRQTQQEKESKPSISNVITPDNTTNNNNTKKEPNWNLINTMIAISSIIVTAIITLIANDNIRNDVFKYFQRNTTPSLTITPSGNPSNPKTKP